MDDYSINSLQDSRNEWCARLVNILTPLMIEGFNSIFDEAWKLCEENDEARKIFNDFSKFNKSSTQVESGNYRRGKEANVIDKSACSYLEDLITCVHIIQVKIVDLYESRSKTKKNRYKCSFIG